MTSLIVILSILLQPVLYFFLPNRNMMIFIDIPLICVGAYFVYQKTKPTTVDAIGRPVVINRGVKTVFKMGAYALVSIGLGFVLIFAAFAYVLSGWQ